MLFPGSAPDVAGNWYFELQKRETKQECSFMGVPDSQSADMSGI